MNTAQAEQMIALQRADVSSAPSAAGNLLVRLVAHPEPAADVLLAWQNTCRLPTDIRGGIP